MRQKNIHYCTNIKMTKEIAVTLIIVMKPKKEQNSINATKRGSQELNSNKISTYRLHYKNKIKIT